MNWIAHFFTSILLFFGVGNGTPEETQIELPTEQVVEASQDKPIEDNSSEEINDVPQAIESQKSEVVEKTKVSASFWKEYQKPSKDILKDSLDSLTYKVTQEEGTERAGTSPLNKNYAPGIYVDILSGEPLFSSKDKYDSHTGWPSFTRPIVAGVVTEHVDTRLTSPRIEIRSAIADNHLGHVFTDGPKESTGLRYCMNGVSLRFIPLAEMEEKGYGAYRKYVE